MPGQKDLEAIGFVAIGGWRLRGDDPRCVLDRLSDAAPALYAFAIGGEVMYVGKTVQTLRKRLYGYEKGSGSQRTNVRVRETIRQALREGRKVDILGFHDVKPGRVGIFQVNLPAALEDDIIRVLDPPWNGVRKARTTSRAKQVAPGGGRRRVDDGGAAAPVSETDRESADAAASFAVTVGRTYFRQGFFNVPITHEHRFPADGGVVGIRLPERDTLLRATVNRRANTNGTPRIMGGTGLRDWFRQATQVGGSIRVRVHGGGLVEITG